MNKNVQQTQPEKKPAKKGMNLTAGGWVLGIGIGLIGGIILIAVSNALLGRGNQMSGAGIGVSAGLATALGLLIAQKLGFVKK